MSCEGFGEQLSTQNFYYHKLTKKNIRFLSFLHIGVTHYEQIRWTVDKLETMQKEFRDGKLIGLYEKENVDDIVK